MDDLSCATGHDMSRQGATDPDTEFTLSLEEAATLYARAGHPRTLRSLQRYCGNDHLDARKIQTSLGDKYLVSRQSVPAHAGLTRVTGTASFSGYSVPRTRRAELQFASRFIKKVKATVTIGR